MKPLRLEMTAFGPFAGCEQVDFTELAGAKLLLIHGPTGSGKTTLLDAMCFALFGDTSGAERDAKQMRSDNAKAADVTEVVYDFSLGPRQYRVMRQPEQQRAAKRGGGITKQAHQATLWQLGNATDGVDGSEQEAKLRVLASGAGKVSAAVKELFGFESEQFRQVVVLPQGQFRKLLLAESKDKQKILQCLFQTQVYDRLERALTERAGALRRSFDDERLKRDELLAFAKVETIAQLQEAEQAAKLQRQQTDQLVPEAEKSAKLAANELQAHRRSQALYEELHLAQVQQRSLQAQAESMEAIRVRYAEGRRAQPLGPMRLAVSTANKRQAHAVAKLSEAKEKAQAADAVVSSATAQAQALEAERPQLQLAEQELTRLRDMHQYVKALHRAQAQFEQLQQSCERLRANLGERQGLADKLQAAAQSHRQLLERRVQEASAHSAARLEQKACSERLARRQALDSLREQLAALGPVVRAAVEAQARADAQLQAQLLAWEQLQAAWRSGQAGALARSLQPGHPCLVCGSREHPSPAENLQRVPTEEQLNQVERLVQQARREAKRCAEAALAAQAQSTAQQARCAELVVELGELADKPLVEVEQQLLRAQQAAQHAAEAVQALEPCREKMQKIESDLQATQRTVEEAKTQEAALQVQRAEQRMVLRQCEEQVPEPYRGAGALEAAGLRARKAFDVLQGRFAEAQANLSSAKQEQAAAVASRAHWADNCDQAGVDAKRAQQEFDQRRADAGFVDTEAFEAALLLTEQLPVWEQQLQKYDGALLVAKERLQRAEAATEGSKPPLEGQVEQMAELADKRLQQTLLAAAAAARDHEQLRQLLRAHDKASKAVALLEKQWQTVESVAGLASGKQPPKISFQRFVLGALLDEVLLAATERLTTMSKGRYSLNRQALSNHKGRAGGLDLEVIDLYTGSARPVSTLSGGESFLAALALSLGLADVVQSYSGGIRLDTLFIDEGFGTLDADALDLALDTLADINAEGRLVGIISHVQELKARIGTRLELVPTQRGSFTRVSRA